LDIGLRRAYSVLPRIDVEETLHYITLKFNVKNVYSLSSLFSRQLHCGSSDVWPSNT